MIYDSLASDLASGDTNGLRAITTTGDSTNRVDLIFLGDGYTASEIGSTFATHIQDYLNYIFDDSALTQPFGRYENFFNVYAVDVISSQSGADDPGTATFRDTALDASYYWDGVTERLLYVSDAKAQAAMNSALGGTSIGAEIRYVLINDSKYGGGGGYFGVFAAGNSSAQEIGLHEIGHSFAGLADEYSGNTGTYTGSEPSQINVTTNSSGVKWAEWLGYDDPALGLVGAYEGGLYYDHGIYRPTDDSKMRSLGRPFDPIAREEFVHRFYQFVDPLDGHDDNVGTKFNVQTLSVDVIDPTVISVDWTVNGQIFVNSGETFSFANHGFDYGSYSVTARAYDPTDWVRGDRSDLEQTVIWAVVIITGTDDAPVITSNGGGENATVLVAENTSAVTGVAATDVDGSAIVYSILGGDDAAQFQINSLTGALSFVAAPNFEAPTDADHNNSYVVQVRAFDGSLSGHADHHGERH